MTVKQIISECLLKMGEKDFVDNETLTEREQELITDLLGALNIVYREVISEYLPLTAKETVFFVNNRISANELVRQILYPIRVTVGETVKSFKAYPDRIIADVDGRATLEYAYLPNEALTLDGAINDMRLTVSALSDGTLGEYYFANKVFDLAKSFDTSFRAKLGIMRYKGKSLLLKERRWWS